MESATSRKTDPGDAWRISLAAGAKLAVATLPLLEEHERSLDEQQALAMAWGLFLFETTHDKAAAEIGRVPVAAGEFDGDDIPF